jgi:5-methylthioadenosine/S-adenosylhomocysteine deaminase
MAMDILIKNGMLVTVDKERRVFKGDIAVDKGRIVRIGDCSDIRADKEIDASDCAVMPGMINTHTHIYQALIEGIGYDMHFEPWNWRFLFPIVSRMTPEHSYASAQVAALEMIKSGTTTVCDHWYMHTYFDNVRNVAKALDESGMRSCIVYGLLDRSFAGSAIDDESMTMVHSCEDLMADVEKFTSEWHKTNRTTVALGVGTTQDASPKLLKMSQEFCLANKMQNNFHVAGWSDLIANCYKEYGMRDVEYLEKLGCVGPNMVYVHAVWLTPEEIGIISKTDTKIAHCPAANSQLAYGISPVSEMLARNIAVGLGTDGGASYTYDMFQLMRTAAYLQKQKNLSADFLTAEQAIELATINGARVLNMVDDIGSLEVGKKADIILVDFNKPHLIPVNRYTPKLVYSANGSDVRTTIIDGKIVMEDYEVKTLNEKSIMEDAVRCAKELVKGASNEDTNKLLNAPWGRTRPYWRS